MSMMSAIKDIADAIRAKGVVGTMSLQEMPTKVSSIQVNPRKWGASVDDFLGDVDANGAVQNPQGAYTFENNNITSVAAYAMQNKFNYSGIVEFHAPNVTSVGNYSLQSFVEGCTHLKKVYLNKLSSCGTGALTNAFTGCTALEVVDMSEATAVPALSNVNAFQNTNDTYKVVVPDSLYSTWITKNNWSSISSHIISKSDWDTLQSN